MKTRGAIYLAIFALTVAFRFLALKNGFVNDHFVYISGGQQVLFGEWPTRGFVDPGLPLMFVASAVAQAIFGQTLLGEAVLVSVAFGLGAVLTAAAVRQLTGSMILAVLAALVEVVVFPRTYSYPKIFAYALECWLFGRYLARPDNTRAFAMAAGIVIAFLFRHDHGLFLGVGGLLTVLIAPCREDVKSHVRAAATFAGFVLLLLLPYLVYVQASGGLWLYFVNGVQFSQREAVRQWHVWPMVFGDERPLESALVYELYLLPLAATVVLLAMRNQDGFRAVAARIVPLVAVALMVNFNFIRDPLNTRLPDAVVPAALLGAWLLSRAFQATRRRYLVIPVASLATLLIVASMLFVGDTLEQIDRAGLLGRVAEIPSRFPQRVAALQSRFADDQIPDRASRALVPFFHYVDRCSAPTDRILVGGFLADVPFFTQRLFAGGQGYFGAYFGSDANERAALRRLRDEVVPFAVLPSDYDEEFEHQFPLIASYLRTRYIRFADVRVDDESTVHLLADGELPSVEKDPEAAGRALDGEAARARRANHDSANHCGIIPLCRWGCELSDN